MAYYKGMRVNILGFPMPWKPNFKQTSNSVNGTVNRLSRSGIIEIKNGEWRLTEKGKKYFDRFFRQGLHADKPLQGYSRLNDRVAAITMAGADLNAQIVNMLYVYC